MIEYASYTSFRRNVTSYLTVITATANGTRITGLGPLHVVVSWRLRVFLTDPDCVFILFENPRAKILGFNPDP